MSIFIKTKVFYDARDDVDARNIFFPHSQSLNRTTMKTIFVLLLSTLALALAKQDSSCFEFLSSEVIPPKGKSGGKGKSSSALIKESQIYDVTNCPEKYDRKVARKFCPTLSPCGGKLGKASRVGKNVVCSF